VRSEGVNITTGHRHVMLTNHVESAVFVRCCHAVLPASQHRGTGKREHTREHIPSPRRHNCNNRVTGKVVFQTAAVTKGCEGKKGTPTKRQQEVIIESNKAGITERSFIAKCRAYPAGVARAAKAGRRQWSEGSSTRNADAASSPVD